MRERTRRPATSGTLRTAQKQLTRARFFEAAIRCFNQLGYSATTIDDIAAAAGATRATFYLHYRGKRDIIVEIRSMLNEEYAPLHDQLLVLASHPNRARIRRWIETAFDHWEKTRPLVVALVEAASSDSELRAERDATFGRDAASLTTALASTRRWSEDESAVRATLLLVQLEQFFLRWVVTDWDLDREVVLNVMVEEWLLLLGRSKSHMSS